LIAVGVAGCGGGSDSPSAGATEQLSETTATLPAATEARRTPPTNDSPPGRVRVEEGPFTDRVEIEALAISDDARPVVRGRIRNSVDVSELIVLELQADFYDARGTFVGTGRQVFLDSHAGAGDEPLFFAIRSPVPVSRGASGILTIPQLANE
jgi:hypothetical protein